MRAIDITAQRRVPSRRCTGTVRGEPMVCSVLQALPARRASAWFLCARRKWEGMSMPMSQPRTSSHGQPHRRSAAGLKTAIR